MNETTRIRLRELSIILGEPIREMGKMDIRKRAVLRIFTARILTAFDRTAEWVKKTNKRYGGEERRW